MIAHSAFIPMFAMLGDRFALINNIACVGLDAACLVLQRRGKFALAGLIFFCAISGHTGYCVLAFGKDAGLLYYYLTLAALVFFSNWRIAFKVCGALALSAQCIFFFEYASAHPPFVTLSQELLSLWRASNVLANIAAIAFSAYYFTRMADEAEKKLRYQASYDYLTGVPNRRTIMEALETELLRSRREGRGFGVIMSDIDHFKAINDSRGHLAGDEALKGVVEALSAILRPYDLIGRYGGEEFIVIVPGADIAATREIAERMRQAVDAQSFHYEGRDIRVTMSFGVTAVEDAALANEVDAILAVADAALYDAKERGRNAVAERRI